MTTTAGPEQTAERAKGGRTEFAAADLLILITVIIWGANYSVIKWGISTMPAQAFNAVRVAMAALALLAMAAWRGEPRPSRRDALALLGLGAIGNGVYQLFFIAGLHHTRAGTAALVVATGPALVAVIGRARGVERGTARRWLGIALQLSGVTLVVVGGASLHAVGSSLLGPLLLLSGNLAWSWFSVSLKKYSGHGGALTIAALTMSGGAILVIIAAIPSLATTRWPSVHAASWLAIIYGGLGSLVIAYVFWANAVRKLGPTRTALYLNLQPLVALAVAWLFLAEQPTGWQLAGATTIMSGLLLGRT